MHCDKSLKIPWNAAGNITEFKKFFPSVLALNISSFCLEFTYWIKKVCLSQRFEPRSSGHEGNTESTELPGYLSSKFHILYTSETLVIMVYVFTKYLQTLKRTDKCILQHASNNMFGKFSFLLKLFLLLCILSTVYVMTNPVEERKVLIKGAK